MLRKRVTAAGVVGEWVRDWVGRLNPGVAGRASEMW
jgi:hypothetical protein